MGNASPPTFFVSIQLKNPGGIDCTTGPRRISKETIHSPSIATISSVFLHKGESFFKKEREEKLARCTAQNRTSATFSLWGEKKRIHAWFREKKLHLYVSTKTLLR
jgi:hypothetical protein